MKKVIVAVALVACAVVVTAQTVTSANIVGYAKVDAVGGELSLVALNFDPGAANTITELIGNDVPNGSTIFLWDMDAGTYEVSVLGSRGSWTPEIYLELGDAFWIQAFGTGTNELIFSGEVLIDDRAISLPAGLSMIGYGYPVLTSWQDTQLSSGLENGSILFVWDDAAQAYDTITKSTRGSWNANPVVGVMDGFWVDNVGSATNISETVPFN